MPDITMHDVKSSNVKALGHDGTDLIVDFLNGRAYRYLDVPESLLMDGLGAPSVGKWLNTAIKPSYQAEARVSRSARVPCHGAPHLVDVHS